MSSKAISTSLRLWLASLGERCEYCLTSEFVTGIGLDADHIKPRAKGGLTNQDNLCRACASCNTNKGEQTEAVDPESGESVPLFNPRSQRWAEHFQWNADGTEIIGLTPCGRATIIALKMNNPRIVRARRLWVGANWHPPTDKP